MEFFDTQHLADWPGRLRDLALSPAILEPLLLQLACIVASFLAAWAIRAATREWTDGLVHRLTTRYRGFRLPAGLRGLAIFCYAWLFLVFAEQAVAQLGGDYRLIGIGASLTGLWIVIRASALLLRDPALARAVAAIAWLIAALDIIGLLPATTAALDNLALTVGTLRISVLLVIKAVLVVAILLWIALGLSRLIDTRLQHAAALSPSVRVLTGNLVRIALISVALLIGLNAVGIDLTAFAVFSGAIGVGIGLGLQKVVSNFVSGIILLLERSIKPGDVIEVGGTFGFGYLSRGAICLGARPRRQRISDPEREPDHQPGRQLVLFEPAGPSRCAIRGRLRQRPARGARTCRRGGEADEAGAELTNPGVPLDRIWRQCGRFVASLLD